MTRLFREWYCLWVHGYHAYNFFFDAKTRLGTMRCFWCGKLEPKR